VKTRIQQKKIDYLLNKGGEIVTADYTIKMPDGATATVDPFGRVKWVNQKEEVDGVIEFTIKGADEFNVEVGGENVGTLTTIAGKYYFFASPEATTDCWSSQELRAVADKLEELNNG